LSFFLCPLHEITLHTYEKINCLRSDPEDDTPSFYWDFGDGKSSVVENPIPHVFATGGLYTASLIVEDSDGMTAVAAVAIDVLQDDGVFVDEDEGIVAGFTLDENIDENGTVEIYGDP
jgi:PKD repeat protein